MKSNKAVFEVPDSARNGQVVIDGGSGADRIGNGNWGTTTAGPPNAGLPNSLAPNVSEGKAAPATDETPSIASHMKSILSEIGEDPTREGLVRTPDRAEKALRFLTSGYQIDIDSIVNGALFTHECDEMVIVKDIEFYSMCEHHLLPFFGKLHVAYLPDKKVIGLSKIPRIADVFARRLQLQERLTRQIAETLQRVLEPRGVGVICEARHFCMMMRGVEKQHSGTVTSAMLGAFRAQKETRDEFLSLVSQRNHSFS